MILSIYLHRKKVEIILVAPNNPIEATIEAIVMGATAAAFAEAVFRTVGEVMTLTILLRIKGELIENNLPTVKNSIDFQNRPMVSL